MRISDFPAELEAAGVNVRYLDGWDTPAKDGYVWREGDGDPAGHMHHHTATASYLPNATKANAYAGMSKHGSLRLYQEDYGDSVPVYTIANIYPAPFSSGAGDKTVLVKVRAGIEVDGRPGPDTSGWYGNTHFWNTEWILNGIGAPIDQRVWDMMVTVCQVQNTVMGWTRVNHIGHGHHTRRKIDLYGGQFTDFDDTINHLRDAMETEIGDIMPEYKETSNPAFQPAWNKAIDIGMYSQWTNPSDDMTAEKLAVFLDRVGLLADPNAGSGTSGQAGIQ